MEKLCKSRNEGDGMGECGTVERPVRDKGDENGKRKASWKVGVRGSKAPNTHCADKEKIKSPYKRNS